MEKAPASPKGGARANSGSGCLKAIPDHFSNYKKHCTCYYRSVKHRFKISLDIYSKNSKNIGVPSVFQLNSHSRAKPISPVVNSVIPLTHHGV